MYSFNTHYVTWHCRYICIHKRMYISALSAPTRHSAAARRRTSFLSIISCIAPWTLHRRRFVGKTERVRVRTCVHLAAACLACPRSTNEDERRRKRETRGMGVTCVEDLLRFTRGSQKRLPPLPPSYCPPVTASFPPRSLLLSYSPSILVVLRRVTPLSFRRRSKNKVPDSRCMNDNLITEGLKSRKRYIRTPVDCLLRIYTLCI